MDDYPARHMSSNVTLFASSGQISHQSALKQVNEHCQLWHNDLVADDEGQGGITT